jgi:hypothetical protein
MFHVREFERWRDAPSDQKGAVVWEQIARHGIATLFPIPGSDPTNILALKAGYDKVLRDWGPDQLEAFIEWLRALRDAARGQLAMLQETSGDCRI